MTTAHTDSYVTLPTYVRSENFAKTVYIPYITTRMLITTKTLLSMLLRIAAPVVASETRYEYW